MTSVRLACLAITFSISLAGSASATVIGNFTGVLTQVDPLLSTAFQVGETFVGNFAYEEDTGQDLLFLDVSFSGGYTTSSRGLILLVNDLTRRGETTDQISLGENGPGGAAVSHPSGTYYVPFFLDITLVDSTATLLTTDRPPPPSQFDSSDFDRTSFSFWFITDSEDQRSIGGLINSVSAVPEAGPMLLLSSGLLGLRARSLGAKKTRRVQGSI